MIGARWLVPNTWNPNEMTDEMREKERRSILRYGFIDPLTVRPMPDQSQQFQIIDGEHRYEIGSLLGIEKFPCWVIDVDEDTAKELTPVLNELRGQSKPDVLGALLKDLMQRRDENELRAVMPFSKQRFDELVGVKTIDWGALEAKQVSPPSGNPGAERWVERVFRMPAEAAEVVDEAIQKAKEEAGAQHDWQGLEYLAADFLGR